MRRRRRRRRRRAWESEVLWGRHLLLFGHSLTLKR
jgi:hypothetical protein